MGYSTLFPVDRHEAHEYAATGLAAKISGRSSIELAKALTIGNQAAPTQRSE